MTVGAWPSAFGSLLKRHRVARGLTQEVLAERAGLSARAISDLERGVNRHPHEETLRLLAAALSLSPLDRVALLSVAQGYGEASFDLLHGRPPARSRHPDARPPFVGRERELHLLARHLAARPPGVPCAPPVLLLVGGPGAGKTRLLREAAQAAVAHGLRVLEGDCHRVGTAPYAPVLDALTACIQGRSPDQVRADLAGCGWLLRVLPELAEHLAPPLTGWDVSPEQERRLVCEAAARFLQHVAGPAGTLLVLDNLQWADARALDLLVLLARTPDGSPRILGAYRDSGLRESDALAVAVTELTRSGRAVCHAVAPLPAGAGPSAAPADAAGRVAAASVLPGAVPSPTTSLVGRAHDEVAVLHLLREGRVRLLTLTGPGGIGKTRLALQLAAGLADVGAAGLWFVPLAPLRDPAQLASTIAGALGLPECAERPLDRLCAFLGEKQALLILDNLEHLLPAAETVAALVAACPRLTVLATSRAALRVQGEHDYPVPPLAWPDIGRLPPTEALLQYPAVDLFAQRARAARPDFAICAANARAVAGICARLDGLPLAIELAAARIKILPPQALLTRLVGAYSYPTLRLLSGGARDLPARLQTMRDAIAWSYDLLAPEMRALFRRLAVFADGCTVEAAGAICLPGCEIEALDGLAALVDHSLLRSEEQSDGEARLLMLETIREFGLECLAAAGELDAVCLRHTLHFLALAEAAARALRGPHQEGWLSRLEREHNNLRAALRWARDGGDAALGLRLAAALWRFWWRRGHLSEGRQWLECLLDRAFDASPEVRAEALNGAGGLAWAQGEYAHARECYTACLALRRELGDREGTAATLNNLGCVAWHHGDYQRATALLEESLAWRRELGDAWRIGGTLNNLGAVAGEQGDHARAAALYEESAALFRALGDRRFLGLALANLGDTVRGMGDGSRAAALLEEGIALQREVGDAYSLAYSLRTMARVLHERGAHARALGLFRECLALLGEVDDRRSIAECLECLSDTLCALGHPDRAALLLGAAARLRELLDAPVPPSERGARERGHAAALAQLGAPALAAAWDDGRALPPPQAIDLALAWTV